jgi:NTP pyrophosphatase (non-canonical NTP hydrolase)
MNSAEYQREVERTCSPDEPFASSLTLAALGLAGESGEVTDLIKKHLFHGHTLDCEKLISEMGDVLWYLTFLANKIYTPLDTIMGINAAKLRKRYPNGWEPVRSINREEPVT